MASVLNSSVWKSVSLVRLSFPPIHSSQGLLLWDSRSAQSMEQFSVCFLLNLIW